MKKILIAGGSGLIGQRLTALLQAEGHEIYWLSRHKSPSGAIPSFRWNPEKYEIDSSALKNIDFIISLAGSNIADSRWTNAHKEEVIQSRINIARTLTMALKEQTHTVKKFVSASAIGYYGNRGEQLLTENNDPGEGFLSDTCKVWEDAFANIPVPVVTFRIGIVLSLKGGALPEIAAPLKFGICPIPGNGKQYMSWIHIDDLCSMLIYAMEQEEMSGVYNAVAPLPLRCHDFMFSLRKYLSPNSLPVPAPSFFLKWILGEKSVLVLDSTRVSSSKVMKTGFVFKYPAFDMAIKDLYG